MTTTPQETSWIGDALARFEGPLLRYATRLTGNTDQARDVVQDTFLKLCEADRHRVSTHLAQWLYTVCRNRVYELYRKDKRRQPLTDGLMATQPAKQPAPDALASKSDAAAHAWECLGDLPENQQDVVRLRFQSGLSYREIAAVTGLSVSNVGYLLHTALKRLRDELQSDIAATLPGSTS